jgi:DNA repair protein RecO (recombination protein O)
MEWSDRGIVLSSRPHGETGLVTTLLTRLHGRHAGFVAGGISRKSRPTWQPGNVVEVAWRARQLDQLGHYTGELREAHAARAMDDAVELAGLSAACALIDAALPDREPHTAIFDGFHALLNAIGHAGWPVIYVRLELGLLQELGFGLDLDKCAVTGVTEDLAFVSPKTGRAVSRTAAEPYRDRLIALPAFLSTGGLPADDAELRIGLDLTGFFLERHVFWPHNKPLPAARARFMETLNRQEQHS